MDDQFAYEIIGVGAMDVNFPYEFIGFDAPDGNFHYEFMGLLCLFCGRFSIFFLGKLKDFIHTVYQGRFGTTLFASNGLCILASSQSRVQV